MSYLAEPREVYNLQVDGVPEYFANGVLVHNCDALSYIALEANKKTKRHVEEAPPPKVDPAEAYRQWYQKALHQGL